MHLHKGTLQLPDIFHFQLLRLDSETSKALQKLEEAGVTVYTVDDPDEWLAASQSFYDEAEEKYGWSDGLVDTVKNIIGQ